MRVPIASVGLILLLAACAEPPTAPSDERGAASTSAGGAFVVRGATDEPLSGLMFSCDGEAFAVEGTISFRWHNTQLPSGHWQLSQHTLFQARGVGLDSGRSYNHRGVFNETQVFAVPDGGAFTYDLVGRAHGIVQGSGDNDFFLIHAKWTINANGVVAVDFLDIEFECRG